MTSSDCKQHYLRLSEYKNKNVELKIMKNILNAKNSILQHKKKMLKEKYEELVKFKQIRAINCISFDV